MTKATTSPRQRCVSLFNGVNKNNDVDMCMCLSKNVLKVLLIYFSEFPLA